MMHRTETIDYAIVLSGEITMILDDQDVLLKAGDVVIQCGTNHAWSNRSDAPCVSRTSCARAIRHGEISRTFG